VFSVPCLFSILDAAGLYDLPLQTFLSTQRVISHQFSVISKTKKPACAESFLNPCQFFP
jgi:hypothetical protein